MANALKEHKVASRIVIALLLCAVCIAVNWCGYHIAAATGYPIFFDTLGTIVAGIFGGYMPAILVGYITNMVNGAGDAVSFYYTISSVLIAVFASFLAKRGWFDKPAGVIGAMFVFAICGSLVSSGITWCVYGIPGEWEPSEFAIAFSNATGITGYAAQVCVDFLFDLGDKAVMVIMAVIINKLVPKNFKKYFELNIWQQRPLNDEEFAEASKIKTRRFSIQTKIVGIVAIVVVAVIAVTVIISSLIFFRTHVETQSKMGEGIAELMVERINANRVDTFLENGETAPGYNETEESLKVIRDRFPDVEYVYVYKIEEDGCHVVFDLDTEELEGSETGTLIEFDPSFEPLLPSLLAGEEIDPIVSNDSYGWLLTVYKPVYDDKGVCQCYVGVDVSMNHLVSDGFEFLIRLIILSSAFFIFICLVTIWIAEYSLILPINSISQATSNFAFDSDDARSENVNHLEDVGIRTGDEIENLYAAITKTTADTMNYIDEAQENAQTIERMQDNLIMVMADLVESRDKYTGDHVRKTAAYTRVIMEQLREDGDYADEMTDEFVRDVAKSAPLHDIGKIAVSDTILNKPGKLTDEEFAIMKGHARAGAEILADAKKAMADPGYLDEACRLAAHHHEKWNGKGYPDGLAGEEIPLSARIMAVADVFDALVSKRSYKEGMPLDKAFSIIREEAGEHFDPVIAQAFLRAEDKVRRIAERHGDAEGTAGDIRDED